MKQQIEFDAQLDKKTLNRFLIRNNFLRVGGVAGLLISIAAIAGLIAFWKYFAVSQRVILVFLGLMFPVIQPLMLLTKGWNQLKNGTFRKPFHYVFTNKGVEVTNIAGSATVEWKEFRRAVTTKDAIYLYVNSVSAFIIPRAACPERYIDLVKQIKEHTK